MAMAEVNINTSSNLEKMTSSDEFLDEIDELLYVS
jgi:hypothetical protein